MQKASSAKRWKIHLIVAYPSMKTSRRQVSKINKYQTKYTPFCVHYSETCQYCPDCKKGTEPASGMQQYPWIASIGSVSDFTWRHKCIGTIVGTNKILAPAKCFNDLETLKIKVGSELSIMDLASVGYEISSVWISKELDIAMVYTTENIEFTDTIRPICLPQIPGEYDDSLNQHAVDNIYW